MCTTAQKGSSGDPDDDSRSIFSFDSLSQLTEESQAIEEDAAHAIAYAYDKGGNRHRLPFIECDV